MDTCQASDKFLVGLENFKLQNDEIEVEKIKTQQELHYRKAKSGHQALRDAILNPDVHAISFDLQLTLSTPNLATGPIFYKRKLRCYNLSKHSLGDSQGHFFMWDESTTKRGSDEIDSCLKM
ncbi:unnamed protein product [Diabrotica balteata]|uniref:Uncharacterized protein n=1 Tax=Diabrotica balteata TaxID=107213 RepID=A0A9N9TB86_DIABA|nr:unnamed protein product [Diabrotica balteata]